MKEIDFECLLGCSAKLHMIDEQKACFQLGDIVFYVIDDSDGWRSSMDGVEC